MSAKTVEPRWHANASVKDRARTTMVERHHLDGKISLVELMEYVYEHIGGQVDGRQVMVNASLTWERPTTPDEAERFARHDREYEERKREYHRRMVRIFEEEYGPDRSEWPRATDDEWQSYQNDLQRMHARAAR